MITTTPQNPCDLLGHHVHGNNQVETNCVFIDVRFSSIFQVKSQCNFIQQPVLYKVDFSSVGQYLYNCNSCEYVIKHVKLAMLSFLIDLLLMHIVAPYCRGTNWTCRGRISTVVRIALRGECCYSWDSPHRTVLFA